MDTLSTKQGRWTDGQMDRWTDRWMDGWMDGCDGNEWMDGLLHFLLNYHYCYTIHITYCHACILLPGAQSGNPNQCSYKHCASQHTLSIINYPSINVTNYSL